MLDFVLSPSWAAVWFWVLCLIALVWLRRHADLNRGARDPVLPLGGPSATDGPLPKLSVLVAAKDEEANIETCLRGLLAQEYPALEVIAIDDRSRDRTGAIMDALAASDARLRIVHVRTLPAGWTGKNHAMHVGVQQATGDYLCFTDADCRFHAPQLLASAVRFARRENFEFLSVLPQLEAHTFWERIVQPPAGAIMVFWFPPEKVNDPHSSRAYANGAFMLLTRAAYDALGGHDQHRCVMAEDMCFARAAKRAGVRLRVIRGGGAYSVRMYVGFRQIWAGWTRIFYCSFDSWLRLFVSALFLLAFSLSPTLSLLASPFLGTSAAGIAAAASAALVAQQSVLWRFYGLCDVRGPWALTYPLGAALCFATICNAVGRRLGVKTVWRGDAYPGAG